MSLCDFRAAVPAAALAFLASAILLSRAAPAHVTLDAAEAPAASYHKAVFRVPHGCDGAPTLRLTVRLPDSILTARPQPKPGWDLSVERQDLSEPRPGPHGTVLTERVVAITWSGGSLPHAFFDEFAILVRLPDGPVGAVLPFPVLQDCATGARRWTAMPDGDGTDGADGRAPALRLTASPQGHRH